jgi:predicted transcriptional regulator
VAVELDVDERQRVSLGKVIGKDVKRVRVDEMADGAIMLTPVISLSERELSVLANPERVASIKAGILEAKEGRIVRHEAGHWEKLLESLGGEE